MSTCKHPVTSVTESREITTTVNGKAVTLIEQKATCVDCGQQCETNII